MPCIRLSIRTLMVLVLLVALLLFGEKMRRTYIYRYLKAGEYRQEERDWRKTHEQLERRLTLRQNGDPRYARMSEAEVEATREVSENHRLWADYSIQMARWYEAGTSRPWRPLGKEPPVPRELGGAVGNK
jgi:hypothetical protein